MLLTKIINVDANDLKTEMVEDLKNWQLVHYLLKQAQQYHNSHLQDVEHLMRRMAIAENVDEVLTTLHDAVSLLYRMKSTTAPVTTSLPIVHTR